MIQYVNPKGFFFLGGGGGAGEGGGWVILEDQIKHFGKQNSQINKLSKTITSLSKQHMA